MVKTMNLRALPAYLRSRGGDSEIMLISWHVRMMKQEDIIGIYMFSVFYKI